MEKSLEAAGLCPMKYYVILHQATVEEYVSTISIYDMCNGAEWLQGESCLMR